MYSKWYLKTWFICILFGCSYFVIPPFIGIVLLIIQFKENRKLIKKYGLSDELETRKDKLKKEITTLTNNFELKKTDFERVLQVLAQEKDSEIRKDELEMKKDEISKKINSLYSELRSKRIDVKMELNNLNRELINLQKEIFVNHFNFTDYDGISSEECKNKLSLLKLDEDALIKSEEAIFINSSDPKKVINNNIKQILRCFNSECDNIMLNLSVKSIDTMRNRITKSFETLNKIFITDGISISKILLNYKLEELNLVYTYELKKVQEQAQQKAIKEQMIEEEKARRDIEKEKAKIAKDQTQCNNEVHKLMQYLSKTQNDVEKQLYLDKIKELEDKLKELEISKENILSHEANALAGFVYIISNIGSFGEDIYKIGMTRRLEPMDRIKELSSASVPFEFDVHAMIFSDNAPTLETTLHQEFRENSINKINFRKEFFKISLDTVESFVKANFNNTVTFTKTALATEYRQTLAIS